MSENQSEIVFEPIAAVFVYGTLQTGECRAGCWPHRPKSIEHATIRGRLHDLGPYPALAEGEDLIAGELWLLEPEHMPRTLEVLDAVEAAAGEGKLYERRLVTCRLGDSTSRQAFAYYFAHPERLARFPVIPPGADGRCHWKRVASHRIATWNDE